MVFHVERNIKNLISKGLTVILIAFLFSGCVARQRLSIPDYAVLPKGKDVLGKKELNAFIFENYQKDMPFQNFLMRKFKLNSIMENEFWITISGQKYKLLIYDNSELEKYFVVSDFIITNQNPAAIDPDAPKFIAISMLSDTNDDCLSEDSLFYNIATDYLKKLKDEYNRL